MLSLLRPWEVVSISSFTGSFSIATSSNILLFVDFMLISFLLKLSVYSILEEEGLFSFFLIKNILEKLFLKYEIILLIRVFFFFFFLLAVLDTLGISKVILWEVLVLSSKLSSLVTLTFSDVLISGNNILVVSISFMFNFSFIESIIDWTSSRSGVLGREDLLVSTEGFISIEVDSSLSFLK